MKIELKKYQQDTINALKQFFQDCRIMGAKVAYDKITSENVRAARLGRLRDDYGYRIWDTIPNAPRVCLKVPTGGGKTIIAAHAIKVVADTWVEKENPVVLWFCPSDTIRRQTSDALKNPRHPYREVLNEQFDGRVKIFDIDEKFNIRPSDIANNTCIIVSTIQAFRHSNPEKYNVYRRNENLEPFFARIENIEKVEGLDRDAKGGIINSFANLMYIHCPIMIVDEAHNVISELSQKTMPLMNPSAIVELTATPQLQNNTLYNVRPAELKDEEMIKLPIELYEYQEWEQAVAKAIAKLAELDEVAKGEKDYIRPILLFQAQNENEKVNVKVLRDYLVNTENIPDRSIAVATGEQKELDGVDVFDKGCPIKYVITVEALKEGWDCSFAYILCSLSNIRSNNAVEQLLGRVMRMPYAKTREADPLNKAYAYVISDAFGSAPKELIDKLKNKGFDETEAKNAIVNNSSERIGFFGRSELNKIDIEKPIKAEYLPATIQTENDGRTIVFTKETTGADIEKLAQHVSPDEFDEIQYKFPNYRRSEAKPSPAKNGEKFKVPHLKVELNGEWLFPEPDRIFEDYDLDIGRLVRPELTPNEFNIVEQGNTFIIELNGNRLVYSYSREHVELPMANVEGWTETNLVVWLDKHLHQKDISQPKMVEWLRCTIEYLISERRMTLAALMTAKYALADRIEAKIEFARKDVRPKWFNTQMALFERESRVMLDFDNGFEFTESMYDGQEMYNGNYQFTKHFLGPFKVPKFDGKIDGEEFECAKTIDRTPQVKYWLRNAKRHRKSFWLPTSTDKFYPDFVALLEDGRILVVEYKGDRVDSEDTNEKKMFGELWERQSNGKGLFLLAVKPSYIGLEVFDQIRNKIDSKGN